MKLIPLKIFLHYLICKFSFLWVCWNCLLCQASVAVSDWHLPSFILYGILHIDIQFLVCLAFEDSSILGYFAILPGTYSQTFAGT